MAGAATAAEAGTGTESTESFPESCRSGLQRTGDPFAATWRRHEQSGRPLPAIEAATVATNGSGSKCGRSHRLFETPVILPLLKRVERKQWGLGPRTHLPRFALRVAGVLWMDYTLYLWHILTHRVPWLWRFHAVHHVDLDMDASTALRFHFGEMIASIPYRTMQVVLFGVDEPAFRAWQTFLLASIRDGRRVLPGREEIAGGWPRNSERRPAIGRQCMALLPRCTEDGAATSGSAGRSPE